MAATMAVGVNGPKVVMALDDIKEDDRRSEGIVLELNGD
jgi:hypothetical protein